MHYTFVKYNKTIGEYFYGIKTALDLGRISPSAKLYWLENVAQPIHSDKYVHEFKDWRTYHRLLLFNHLVVDAIANQSIPIQVIPAFYSTLALFDKMCDCSHYPSDAKMPLVVALVDELYSLSRKSPFYS